MADIPVRELSQRLFKASYRLEVGAAIATRVRAAQRFCNKEIAAELGDPPGKNGVSVELQTLKRSGLVWEEERVDRIQYLRAADDLYWDMCSRLAAGAEEYLRRAGAAE